MNALKKRLKSKTYRAGLILGTLTIIEAKQGIITELVPVEYRPFLPLVFPLVMFWMRELTTGSVDEK